MGYSYAGGQSEIVMGKAVKKYGWNRNDLVITTKVRVLHLEWFRELLSLANKYSLTGEAPMARFS